LTDVRQTQIAVWTKMRRVGKLRYVCMYGLQTGTILAVAMIAVAWIKGGAFEITIEAIVGFVVGGLLGVAGARAEWNKLESIYPDIGTDR
jgi:hypothetical protein